MKHIIESIIGKKGATPLPLSFKGLRYGDVVEIYNGGDISAYIYIPLKNIKLYTLDYDGFVKWSNNDAGISCWQSSGFEQYFPNHRHWGDVKITRYITHIDKWQSISSGDDIKKLFNKYNIPIDETH